MNIYIYSLLIIIISSILFILYRKSKKKKNDYLKGEAKELLELRKKNDYEGFIKFFKEKKINPNSADPNNTTILMYSINPNFNECEKYAEFLLSNGADVNIEDKAGRTAVLMASHWNDPIVLKTLLKYNPNLDTSTYKRGRETFPTNPLLSCLWKENENLANILFMHGASPYVVEDLMKKFPSKLSDKSLKLLENFKDRKERRNLFLISIAVQKIFCQKTNTNYKSTEKSIILAKLPTNYINSIFKDYL